MVLRAERRRYALRATRSTKDDKARRHQPRRQFAAPDRSRFHLEFDWTGTHDVSAVLSIPYALRYLDGLVPGGFAALMPMNHALALEARRILADRLRAPLGCPDDMVGSMAAVSLPDATVADAESLHRALQDRWRIE